MPDIVRDIKHAYIAWGDTNCETVKHTVIPAHIEADSHEALVLIERGSREAIAAAHIMISPDKAEKNLTANSDQPKIFSANASSHHAPIERPATNTSPILGINLFPPADM